MSSKNIFIESSPSLYLHEWTKNFRQGPTNLPVSNTAEQDASPGKWIDKFFPASLPQKPLIPATNPFATSRRTGLETLSYRRSSRKYDPDQTFTRDDLAHFLALCYPAVVTNPDYQPDPYPHGGLKPSVAHVTGCRLVPLVLRVKDLEASPYYYDERQRTLRQIRQESPLPQVQANFFQAEFTLASTIILTVGSLADYLGRYGDRGYRYMLLDTGTLIQRMYFSASYLGLSGCTTGSIIQEQFNQWLGLDGYQGCVLKAFAIGPKLPELVEENENA